MQSETPIDPVIEAAAQACYRVTNETLRPSFWDGWTPQPWGELEERERELHRNYARAALVPPGTEATGEDGDLIRRERAACAYLAECHTGLWDNATAEAIAAAIRERDPAADDFTLVSKKAWATVQPFWLLLRHGEKLPVDLQERMDAALDEAPFREPERLLGPEWGQSAFASVFGEKYTPKVWGKHRAHHHTALKEAVEIAAKGDPRLSDVLAAMIWWEQIVSNRAQYAFEAAYEAKKIPEPPAPTPDLEALASELRRLVSYGRWQIEEGGAYHPTLGSALASAEAALAARGLHTAAINQRLRERLAERIAARRTEEEI